jgi:alpha-glucosidase
MKKADAWRALKKMWTFTLLIGMFFLANAQADKLSKLSSPDKSTSVEIAAKSGKLQYRVFFNGQELTTWSSLGLQCDDLTIGENTIIKGQNKKKLRSRFSWPFGEDDVITNNCNEIQFSCASGSVNFNFIVRVYDGSVAFRYELPSPGVVNIIKKELTEFNFTDPYTLYQYHHESVFTPVSIDSFNTSSDLPTTLHNGMFYVSIGEADNDNYTKAELKRSTGPHSVAIAFVRDAAVKPGGSFLTPWRTISVSKTAIGLHDFSQLYLKLNPSPNGGIPPGIKPGKLIRAQLNTQSGLDCVDFAASHNMQYVMFDGGWYGTPPDRADPRSPIPALDLHKVIRYGNEKGIDIILYVDYAPLKKYLDEILPLYKKWGVAGLKFGFVDGFTQAGISWLASAIKKVNDFGFVLNIHDNYKPTGLSRTYPFLLTQEGIRGDENSPDAFHTTTLPFTRFLSGPADFTFCYPNSKNSFSKNLKVSMGQQLALTVIYFSPLQALFWYGQPNDYTNEAEIEFFKYVPTVWNESRYLAGEIGKNISVARRKGNTWFVGNAAGLNEWQTTIPFDFLTKGKWYTATIYEDNEHGSIRKRTIQVKKGDSFTVSLKEKTGQAIMIEPTNK